MITDKQDKYDGPHVTTDMFSYTVMKPGNGKERGRQLV